MSLLSLSTPLQKEYLDYAFQEYVYPIGIWEKKDKRRKYVITLKRDMQDCEIDVQKKSKPLSNDQSSLQLSNIGFWTPRIN